MMSIRWEKFYRDLKQRGICVQVGMEATGYSRWFERLLAELGFELWIGDPAEIKAKRVKTQKFDREDEGRSPLDLATRSVRNAPLLPANLCSLLFLNPPQTWETSLPVRQTHRA
jgi:hypothetical protein